MYLARFCLVNCLLTLVRSHKCHEWNHRELIAIVETWSCWQKKKRAREPQQLDNKWTIIRTSMDGGLDFFGSRQTTNKTIGFFLLNLPLSKAIWAHIFIVLKYKQLWEDSCAQVCRYFFSEIAFLFLELVNFGRFFWQISILFCLQLSRPCEDSFIFAFNDHHHHHHHNDAAISINNSLYFCYFLFPEKEF